MNKFELVRQRLGGLVGGRKDLTLLDVGCRGCELRRYIRDLVEYRGLDLVQNADNSVDYVLDLSVGLPMADQSFDFVAALDVIEHVDDMDGALKELVRVANRAVIVMLPNMAHAIFRRSFLLQGRIGAKYDLTYGMGQDRHRWLTVLPQMDEYMSAFAAAHRLKVSTYWFNDSRKKRLFAGVARAIALPPSWWVWASMYVLSRGEHPSGPYS